MSSFKQIIRNIKIPSCSLTINDLDKIIASEDRNVGRNTSVETSEKTGNILDMLERSLKK